MKRFLLVILYVIIFQPVFAQPDSIKVWNKWCSKADTSLLYNTANNVLQIICRTIPASELIIKSLDNALKIGKPEIKGDTISLMAMPYPKSGKRMRLSISLKKNAKPLKIINFYADDLPPPVARLGNIIIDKPTRKDILNQTMLRVAFPNSFYSYPYRVKEYTFKARIGGKDISIPVKGPFISKEIGDLLAIAAEGTFIEFVAIKATCPECSPRTIESLKIWIK